MTAAAAHGTGRRLRLGAAVAVAVAVAVTVLGTAGVLGACGSGGGAAAGGGSSVKGAAVFGERCASCHRPGGPGADFTTTKPPAVFVAQTVRSGRMAQGMPSFQGVLSDADIEAVSQYVATYKS